MRAGDSDWFTKPMIASYHTVWFELHEDLLEHARHRAWRARASGLMANARFGRVLTAMVTPFDDDGSLDLDGAVALARWLVDHGNDGLVLAGTTGEAPTLTDDEKVELWTAVREAVDVPLVAGTGTNDTRHTCELSERAAATGVDGAPRRHAVLQPAVQAGLDAHFRAVAAATDLPVVLYDIPGRTGRKIDTDAADRAWPTRCPTIVGRQGRRRQPRRDRPGHRRRARRLRGVQRRRRR